MVVFAPNVMFLQNRNNLKCDGNVNNMHRLAENTVAEIKLKILPNINYS